MKKVLVLGCCGSGKSTFSKQLSEITGLPIIHLDQHFFAPNWVEPTTEKWEEKVRQLCQQDFWIMDGNYGGTLHIRLKEADTIIYLDNGTASSLYRVIKRIIKHYGKVRPDMAPGCKERFDLEFLFYVLHFNQVKKPSILKRVHKNKTTENFLILSSNSERSKFLQSCSSAT